MEEIGIPKIKYYSKATAGGYKPSEIR